MAGPLGRHIPNGTVDRPGRAPGPIVLAETPENVRVRVGVSPVEREAIVQVDELVEGLGGRGLPGHDALAPEHAKVVVNDARREQLALRGVPDFVARACFDELAAAVELRPRVAHALGERLLRPGGGGLVVSVGGVRAGQVEGEGAAHQKLLEEGLAGGRGRARVAHGQRHLAGRDVAEVQVRREAARARAIGVVVIVGVGRKLLAHEAFEPAPRLVGAAGALGHGRHALVDRQRGDAAGEIGALDVEGFERQLEPGGRRALAVGLGDRPEPIGQRAVQLGAQGARGVLFAREEREGRHRVVVEGDAGAGAGGRRAREVRRHEERRVVVGDHEGRARGEGGEDAAGLGRRLRQEERVRRAPRAVARRLAPRTLEHEGVEARRGVRVVDPQRLVDDEGQLPLVRLVHGVRERRVRAGPPVHLRPIDDELGAAPPRGVRAGGEQAPTRIVRQERRQRLVPKGGGRQGQRRRRHDDGLSARGKEKAGGALAAGRSGAAEPHRPGGRPGVRRYPLDEAWAGRLIEPTYRYDREKVSRPFRGWAQDAPTRPRFLTRAASLRAVSGLVEIAGRRGPPARQGLGLRRPPPARRRGVPSRTAQGPGARVRQARSARRSVRW